MQNSETNSSNSFSKQHGESNESSKKNEESLYVEDSAYSKQDSDWNRKFSEEREMKVQQNYAKYPKKIPGWKQKRFQEPEMYNLKINITFKIFGISVFCGILAMILIYKLQSQKKTICNFDPLQNKYKEYENLISSVSNITRLQINREFNQSTVYLLMVQDEAERISSFITELLNTTANCFDTNYAEVTHQDIEHCSKDYGCIIVHYKNLNSPVVLIQNLHMIPPNMALSLHEICDTYSPMIFPSTIFLTLTLQESFTTGKTTKEIATEVLENLWVSLDENSRLPIIARVTEQVFSIPIKN